MEIKERIEKILKEKIGTKFSYDNTKGFNVYRLDGYGCGVFIIHDVVVGDKLFTRVLYPTLAMFTISVEQEQEHYDMFLISSIKMMVDLRHKLEKGGK